MKNPQQVLTRSNPKRRGVLRLGAACLLALAAGVTLAPTSSSAEASPVEPAMEECFFEKGCEYLCELYEKVSATVCSTDSLDRLVTGFCAPVGRRSR